MSTNPKQAIKKIVLASFSITVISSFTIFSFVILENVCSQIIDSVIIYYNAIMQKQSPIQ
jgi:hypothetical protein